MEREAPSYVAGTTAQRRNITAAEYEAQGRIYTERCLLDLAEKLRDNPQLARAAPAFRSRLARLAVRDATVSTALAAAALAFSVLSCAAVQVFVSRERNEAHVSDFLAKSGPSATKFVAVALQEPIVFISCVAATFMAYLAYSNLTNSRYMSLAKVPGLGAIKAALPVVGLCTSVMCVLALVVFLFGDSSSVADHLGKAFRTMEDSDVFRNVVGGIVLTAVGPLHVIGVGSNVFTAFIGFAFFVCVVAASQVPMLVFFFRDFEPVSGSVYVVVTVLGAVLSYFASSLPAFLAGGLIAIAVAAGGFACAAIDLLHAIRSADEPVPANTWTRAVVDNDAQDAE